MKKLIVFSVVLAMLTGAAFAQVNIGVEAWAGANLLWNDDTEQDEGPYASPGIDDGAADDGWQGWGAAATFSYETPGGEAGVSFTIEIDGVHQDTNADYDAVSIDFGGAWWYIIPQLRVNLGQAGFDRGDATDYHYEEGSGNWFGLSILPVDFITINLAFINEDIWGDRGGIAKDEGSGNIADQFGNNFMLQAIVDIPGGFGQVAFTYDNWVDEEGTPLGDFIIDGEPLGDFAGRGIFIDYSGAFDIGPGTLGIDAGFTFIMGNTDYTVFGGDWVLNDPSDPNSGFTWEPSVISLSHDDINIWGFGVAASYNIMGIDLGASFDVGQVLVDASGFDNSDILVNLGFSAGYSLPVDPFTLGLSASIDLLNVAGQDDWGDEGDLVVEWEIGVELARSIGGFTFTAGFELGGDSLDDTGVWFGVPIKFSYSW